MEPQTIPNSPELASKPEHEMISVWVRKQAHSPSRMFFCFICRTSVFKYKGNLSTIIAGDPDKEGEEILKFPLAVKCQGKSNKYGSCPAVYIVEGYVE